MARKPNKPKQRQSGLSERMRDAPRAKKIIQNVREQQATQRFLAGGWKNDPFFNPKPKGKGGKGGKKPPPYPGYLSPDEIRRRAREDAAFEFDLWRKEIQRQEDEAKADARKTQEWLNSLWQGYAEWAKFLGPATQGIYRTAAGDISGYAEGYAGGLEGVLDTAANEANATLDAIGAPAGQDIAGGEGAAQILSGVGGWIPSSSLARTGAAFAAADSHVPVTLRWQGLQEVKRIQKELDDIMKDFRKQRSELSINQATETRKIMAEYEKQQAKLAENHAKARTAAEKDFWKRQDSKAKLLTQQTGYLWTVNNKGQVVLMRNKKGDPVRTLAGQREDRLRHEANEIDTQVVGSDATGRSLINKETGEVIATISDPVPPNSTFKGSAEDGVLIIDPKTGQITGFIPPWAKPKGKDKKGRKLTQTERTFIGKQMQYARNGYFADPDNPEVPLTPSQAQARRDAGQPLGKYWPTFTDFVQILRDYGIPLPRIMSAARSIWNPNAPGAKKGFVYVEEPNVTVKSKGPLGVQASVPPGKKKIPVIYFPGRKQSPDEGMPVVLFKPKAKPMGDTIPGNQRLEKYARLWIQAGGDPAVAYTAAAIALAESGGKATARNHSSIEDSRGLWQINTYAHPWALSMNLYDPLQNAKAAVRVYNSNSRTFNPWSVYKSGAYKKYLGGGDGQDLKPTSTDWGGSQSVANQLRDVSIANGLTVSSAKRETKNTKSGGISDHWVGNKNAYAYDMAGSVAQMDEAIKDLLEVFGVRWGGGEVIKNFYRNGYRIQILYRTYVGGNHFNHIHIGVKKV